MQLKQLREHFVATNLERRLKADQSGRERDRILNELTECEFQIESAKRAGLSSSDFAAAERMLRSLRVSANVVRAAWNSFNAPHATAESSN